MSDYTREAALQRGRDRITGKDKTEADRLRAYKVLITKTLKRLQLAEDYGTGVFIAVAVSVLKGSWNDDVVISALNSSGIETPLAHIREVLVQAKILEWKYQRQTKKRKKRKDFTAQFTHKFWDEYIDIVGDIVREAPAHMLPLNKSEDWVQGEPNSMNLQLIPRAHPQVIKKVPQSVMNAVNKLQAVQYIVSQDLINVLQNRWQDLEDKPTKPPKFRGERMVLQQQIMHLQAVQKLKSVSFQITLDFRGRAYYRGGVITPQGHDFCKAAFQFKKSLKLGKTGKDAIAIHYANVYGLDKKSITEKLQWADDIGTKLSIPIVEGAWFPANADKPYQTVVAASEWYRLQQHLKAGEKAQNFRSNLVCHTDGTCNGFQHASAVTGHRPTAESVNCTSSDPSDTPRDIYGECTDEMIVFLEKHGGQEELIKILKRIGRLASKFAVMVTGFGAGQTTALKQVYAELTPEDKQFLATSPGSMDALDKALEHALQHVAGSILILNEVLQYAVTQKMIKEGPVPLYWKTADGFPVMQASRARKIEDRTYAGAGDFIYRTDKIDPKRQVSGICANFIHSQDGTHLRVTVEISPFDIVAVHDSLGCHARNYTKLNKNIRISFIYIHKYDQVRSLNRLSHMQVITPKIGDYDPSEVMGSAYFFS